MEAERLPIQLAILSDELNEDHLRELLPPWHARGAESSLSIGRMSCGAYATSDCLTQVRRNNLP